MESQAKRRVRQSKATVDFKMKKGFTLIELLVVIVIIGVLMGILLVSYQGTRVTARNGKRKADLEQIRAALELYHADCGQYPGGVSFGGSLSSICPGSTVTYMTRVPQDPLADAGYSYRYAGALHTYDLCAFLEGGGEDLCPGTGSFGSCGSDTCNYKTCQP